MKRDSAVVEDLIAERVSARVGGRDVRVSLTPDGHDIAERLGAEWFAAAVRSLACAHPGATLELLLQVCELEPMVPPEPILPALSGPMYGQGRALGRVTVAGHSGSVCRTLQIPSHAILDETAEYNFLPPTSLKRRVIGGTYGRIFSRAPLLLDEWRQARNERHLRATSWSVPATGFTSGGADLLTDGLKPVAWFALHWLEAGGAETWAFDAAQIAADSGYEVVITADVGAPQRLLDRALAISDHVYLGANVLADEDWQTFLVNLVETYRPTVVHVHHSSRAYSFLPELRHRLPHAKVMDSTHIVEHRTGGFVKQSVLASPYIDVHHVISPQLRDLYLMDAGVSNDKVAYHPLVSESDLAHVQLAPPARGEGPLRIGFLGRLAPQKRPFLFVALVARLHRANPGMFEFVMQGSGVLDVITSAQIARAGVQDVLVRRPWGPVEDFLDDIDVLVISSDNEGLTLTSLEAERHGVLVLSADVGSQRTVVAEQLLVPRAPRPFLARAVRALQTLAASPTTFARCQREQRSLVRTLGHQETASSFLTGWLTPQTKEKN